MKNNKPQTVAEINGYNEGKKGDDRIGALTKTRANHPSAAQSPTFNDEFYAGWDLAKAEQKRIDELTNSALKHQSENPELYEDMGDSLYYGYDIESVKRRNNIG